MTSEFPANPADASHPGHRPDGAGANDEMGERGRIEHGAQRPRGERKRGGRGEQLQVLEAEFRSYYGRPIIKAPVWKNPDVPLYLFLGGLAGTSSGLAALAGASGRRP